MLKKLVNIYGNYLNWIYLDSWDIQAPKALPTSFYAAGYNYSADYFLDLPLLIWDVSNMTEIKIYARFFFFYWLSVFKNVWNVKKNHFQPCFVCLDSDTHDKSKKDSRRKIILVLKCLYFRCRKLIRFWDL